MLQGGFGVSLFSIHPTSYPHKRTRQARPPKPRQSRRPRLCYVMGTGRGSDACYRTGWGRSATRDHWGGVPNHHPPEHHRLQYRLRYAEHSFSMNAPPAFLRRGGIEPPVVGLCQAIYRAKSVAWAAQLVGTCIQASVPCSIQSIHPQRVVSAAPVSPRPTDSLAQSVKTGGRDHFKKNSLKYID